MRKNQSFSLDELMRRIRKYLERDFDLVVAIERGGLLPAYLASRFLNIPMRSLCINLRDKKNRQRFETPRLVEPKDFFSQNKKILLVDDVAKSGATLAFAKGQLSEAESIKTLVIYGVADISLFGELNKCVLWPWDKGAF